MRGGWRSWLAGSVFAALLAATSASSALDVPSDASRLEWRAPAECPGRDEVVSQIGVLAAEDGVRWARFSSVAGDVKRRGERWVLELAFVSASGSRRRALESPRCADLAQAAAVAIVIALRGDGDDGGAFGAPSAAEPEASASPTAAQVAPAAAATSSATNDVAARDVAARDVANSDAARTDAGDTLDPSLAIAASGLVDLSTLGSAAPGAGLDVALGLGAFTAGLYGAGFPSVTTRRAGDGGVAIGLLTGGARGCFTLARAIDACAHVELGSLSAEGVGLDESRTIRDTWVAPGSSVGFRSTPFDGFGITTRLLVFHPLVRGRFRVDGDVVHEVPDVSFRLALGVDVPVP